MVDLGGGGGLVRLTENGWVDGEPAWSPDGSALAFTSWGDGDGEVWVMDADGADPRQLTDNDWEDGQASWSPGGSALVFTSWADGDGELWVMDADGADPRQLTDNDWEDGQASWSPDGSALVFTSWADGDGEVYVIDAAGSAVQVTDNDWEDVDPAWSPDGLSVVFASDADGDFDVFVADYDGGARRRVTDDAGDERGPSWSPDGALFLSTGAAGGGVDVVVRDVRGAVSAEVPVTGEVVLAHPSGLVAEVPAGALPAGTTVVVEDVTVTQSHRFEEVLGGPVYEITSDAAVGEDGEGVLGAPVELRFALPADVGSDDVVGAYFDEDLELWLPLESRVDGDELVAVTDHFSLFSWAKKKVATGARRVAAGADAVGPSLKNTAGAFVDTGRDVLRRGAVVAGAVRDRVLRPAGRFLKAAAEAGLDALEWVGYQFASKVFNMRAPAPRCTRSGPEPAWLSSFRDTTHRDAALHACLEYDTTNDRADATLKVVNNRGWPVFVRRADSIDGQDVYRGSPRSDDKGNLDFISRTHRDLDTTAMLAASIYYTVFELIVTTDIERAEREDLTNRFILPGLGAFEMDITEPPIGPGSTSYEAYYSTPVHDHFANFIVIYTGITAGIFIDAVEELIVDTVRAWFRYWARIAGLIANIALCAGSVLRNLANTTTTSPDALGALIKCVGQIIIEVVELALQSGEYASDATITKKHRIALKKVTRIASKLAKVLAPLELAFKYLDAIETFNNQPEPITLTWKQPPQPEPDQQPDTTPATQSTTPDQTTQPDPRQPTTPATIHEYTVVSAGWGHSCGLRTDGTITCWGSNYDGEAEAPAGSFSVVSAGWGHSCGLRTDGTITCWGSNYDGEAEAPAGSFSVVSAGGAHSCGLRTDATITCWGYNDQGVASSPAGSFSVVSASGPLSCGLRTDGTITCWGSNYYGQAEAPGGSFSAVSAGGYHSCGLRSDATITCWGSNDRGQAEAPAGSFSVVSAGREHTCGLRSDATIACWGDNYWGQSDAPGGSFTAVSAGWGHSCGLRTDGTITCWGRNYYGEAEAPAGSF